MFLLPRALIDPTVGVLLCSVLLFEAFRLGAGAWAQLLIVAHPPDSTLLLVEAMDALRLFLFFYIVRCRHRHAALTR